MTPQDAQRIKDEIYGNLETVLDPCSTHNGTCLSLLELGMIEKISVDDAGAVRIDLFLDDPMCIYMVDIHTQVRGAASSVEGVSSVEIHVVADRLWTPDNMSDSTRLKIRSWEEARRDRGAVTLTLLPTRLRDSA